MKSTWHCKNRVRYSVVFYVPFLTNIFGEGIKSFFSPHPRYRLNRITIVVIYWPSTEPSVKRYTCVNKRKNRGRRWTLNNNITRAQTVWVSWREDDELKASGTQRALGNPAEMRKKYYWVNILACPRLQLISHTQPTAALSRIKCERYIFIEMCVRSFIEVRHYCWLFPLIFVLCICMWQYNIVLSQA